MATSAFVEQPLTAGGGRRAFAAVFLLKLIYFNENFTARSWQQPIDTAVSSFSALEKSEVLRAFFVLIFPMRPGIWNLRVLDKSGIRLTLLVGPDGRYPRVQGGSWPMLLMKCRLDM